MKKILLIILSTLSIITYATDENIENQIGEKLKVDVKFTLPKEIIKYVVYAEKNGVTEDKLILPDFVMSQDSTKAGFMESPPVVYTKRIINGIIEDLSVTEKVTYTLVHPDGFMPKGLNDVMESQGQGVRRVPINFLPKYELEEIVKILGADYKINETGNIVKGNTGKRYAPGAIIYMQNYNGMLTVSSLSYNEYNKLPEEDIKKIEIYIGNGKAFANILLKVSIN